MNILYLLLYHFHFEVYVQLLVYQYDRIPKQFLHHPIPFAISIQKLKHRLILPGKKFTNILILIKHNTNNLNKLYIIS